MIALISLLVIITVSLIVIRMGAVALSMTGISEDMAVFQAQSAFSGVGFTTKESESVVNHPVRRRIIRLLMLMGNAGITSAIASLILTFYRGTAQALAFRLGIAVLGLALLWAASSSKFLNRILTKLIKTAFRRWTDLNIRDYVRLLGLEKGYAVYELEASSSDWLCNHTLSQLGLAQEGVLVLGIRRANGNYIGAPYGDTLIGCNDILTCYGPEKVLKRLSSRLSGAKGDAEHAAAVEGQMKVKEKESKT